MMDANNYELNLEEQENFDFTEQPEVEQFVVDFDDPDDLEVEFGDVVNNSTDDFNALYNRPSYAGEKMTGETDIPQVIHYEGGDGITIEGNVIYATPIQVDNQLSPDSTNPVQNKVIYDEMATKVDADELAVVAFSGEYDDLENEPTDFTQDEWSLLWTNY